MDLVQQTSKLHVHQGMSQKLWRNTLREVTQLADMQPECTYRRLMYNLEIDRLSRY